MPIDPRQRLIVKDKPAQYFLWLLDVDSGQVCQKVRITEVQTTCCKIEDVDDRGVPVSCIRSALLFALEEKARGLGALDSLETGV